MIGRSWTAAIPVKLAVIIPDGKIIDARVALLHEAGIVVVPVLVPIGTKPVAAVIVPFVGEAHGNAVVGERPKLFDEAVFEFAYPLSLQERNDRLATHKKLASIAPATVLCVAKRDLFRIARVPTVLCDADLLYGRFMSEGWQRGTGLRHDYSSIEKRREAVGAFGMTSFHGRLSAWAATPPCKSISNICTCSSCEGQLLLENTDPFLNLRHCS
jgi:hypothetical protein